MSSSSALTCTADGHIVGTDGFVVPANYSEFHSRFPRLFHSYVHHHAPNADYSDHLRLVILLKRYILTGPVGFDDRIAYFSPATSEVATAAHFFNYLWHCCVNADIIPLATVNHPTYRDLFTAHRAFKASRLQTA